MHRNRRIEPTFQELFPFIPMPIYLFSLPVVAVFPKACLDDATLAQFVPFDRSAEIALFA